MHRYDYITVFMNTGKLPQAAGSLPVSLKHVNLQSPHMHLFEIENRTFNLQRNVVKRNSYFDKKYQYFLYMRQKQV